MHAITKLSQLDLSAKYSYADYLTWQFMDRVELIKGHIMKMSPAPNVEHQKVSRQLCGYFWEVFKDNTSQYFDAPFDVRLYKRSKKNELIDTVVQPDICIVCDETKLDKSGCLGAPDLIVEILSPGNSKKEMGLKFELYQANKVREYWIADPNQCTILKYELINDQFVSGKPFTKDDTIVSTLFPGLKIKLSNIFK